MWWLAERGVTHERKGEAREHGAFQEADDKKTSLLLLFWAGIGVGAESCTNTQNFNCTHIVDRVFQRIWFIYAGLVFSLYCNCTNNLCLKWFYHTEDYVLISIFNTLWSWEYLSLLVNKSLTRFDTILLRLCDGDGDKTLQWTALPAVHLCLVGIKCNLCIEIICKEGRVCWPASCAHGTKSLALLPAQALTSPRQTEAAQSTDSTKI